MKPIIRAVITLVIFVYGMAVFMGMFWGVGKLSKTIKSQVEILECMQNCRVDNKRNPMCITKCKKGVDHE